MQNKKSKALTGKNNNRLNAHRPTNNAENAAWADIDKLQSESKVSIPSVQSVREAKDWVDNGSRL